MFYPGFSQGLQQLDFEVVKFRHSGLSLTYFLSKLYIRLIKRQRF